MNAFLRILLVSCFATGLLSAVQAEEPRHLLVAKFQLKRLEQVGLTDEQRAAFNKLSADLRPEIIALRKEAGIDKDAMSRRDHAHQALRPLKLEDEVYWPRLQKDAQLNDQQLEAFRTTQEKYKTFKAQSLKLLTAEQKARLRAIKK